MAKVADRYFGVDEWLITEKGYDPEYGLVSESVFSLGNEYMGIRGYFEEEYTGKQLIGSYFNGIYERIDHGKGGYKGIADSTEYMVNSVNWLSTKISVNGEKLDLATCKFKDYYRELDLRTGILTRKFIWCLTTGKEIEITMERFLSMQSVEYGAQKIIFHSLDFEGIIDVTMGLDFSILHQSMNQNMWNTENTELEDYFMSIGATTIHTNKKVFAACKVSGDMLKTASKCEQKFIANEYQVNLKNGECKEIIKLCANYVNRNKKEEEQFHTKQRNAKKTLQQLSYDNLKNETIMWWKKTWETSDIVIEGDLLNQQGIRFCIFQMFQTYHGAIKGTNIGAKGLTGEAYNGNTFWDTETYCLPFYIFNHMEAAKNLLSYRYETLGKAKERAKDLDCKGAFYPIATISGSECCNLWQHASLQLQASTAVAYGIWFYDKITKDTEFLFDYGAEMLTEISRMLVTRGDYNADHTKFGYYCVMGPDEFQMMVNHNCYTNFMGKFTLEYTNRVWNRLANEAPKQYQQLSNQLGVTESERSQWKKIADDMYIPYDEERQIYEQHDGFFKLPHVDVDEIPMEEFPLYHHWSYDRIYRNDMIKQPDVLMFMFLFSSRFTTEQLQANYEFYEPKCIHESSLSPSVHSIIACQIKKQKEAYDFFQFATRMDLDNYNRNSNEGLHTTSIAAAWMNIIYGFAGMRSDGEVLRFNPTIPANWTSYQFSVTVGNERVKLCVDKEKVTLQSVNESSVDIIVYDKQYKISSKKTSILMPKEWMSISE